MSDAIAVPRHWPLSLPRTQRMSVTQASFLMLLLFALFSSSALAITIRVSPDRDPVAMNETFNLVFSADEKPDDDPDFSPLQKDFQILGQSQGSQMSIVNGSFRRRTEWTLTLAPKQAGTLAIPAISFGGDHSEAITVNVQAAAEDSGGGSPELLLEVQAEPKSPYVQAQVRYTVRVLRRVNFSAADLSEPAVQDALIERLGEDRSYAAERGGQRYAVIERQYAIFPQKSGPFKIEPLTLEAQIPGNGRSRFNSFFGQGSRITRVQSKAVELNVRPIPPEFTAKHWLPAERLELSESWSQSPPQTAVGEPITRTLSLNAKGATVGVLPELDADLSRAVGDQAKLYPDQPALNEEKRVVEGIVSNRQEKTAILPARPGTIALPAVAIPWWNTRADRMEIARLPARTLTVTGTAIQTAAPAAAQEPAPVAPVAEEGLGKAEAAVTPVEARSPDLSGNPWFWGSLIGFLGWLGTAVAWGVSGGGARSRRPAPEGGEDRSLGLRAAKKALQSACEENDPSAARGALLKWAKARWPGNSPECLSGIAARVGGEFAIQVGELERALYGRSDGTWRGARLWELALELQQEKIAGAGARASDLEPLYRG